MPGMFVTHPFKLAFLQNAQEFRLKIQRDLTDFVQEQCATVGQLKASHTVANRSRESSLDVSEELTLEQLIRNGAATDTDQRFAGARLR